MADRDRPLAVTEPLVADAVDLDPATSSPRRMRFGRVVEQAWLLPENWSSVLTAACFDIIEGSA